MTPSTAGAIVAGTCLVGCGAVLALRRPLALIVAAIAAVPLEVIGLPIGTTTITLSEALLLLGAAGWTVSEIAKGHVPFARSTLSSPLVLLVVLIPVGAFVAVDVVPLLKIAVMWVAFLLVFFAIVQDGTPQTVREVLIAVTVASAAAAIVAIVQSDWGLAQRTQGTGFTVEGRAAGPFAHPNTLAAFLGLGLASALGLLGGGRAWWERVLGGATAPLVAFGLALTISRGGILAAVVVLLVFVTWGPVRRVVVAVAVAIVLMTGLGLSPSSADTTRDNIMERLQTLGDIQEQTGELRPYIWSRTAEMIEDHPLIGVGTGQFVFAAPKYGLIEYGDDGYTHAIPHGHDFFLTIAAERGLVAGLVFLWFCVSLVVLMVKTLRASYGLAKDIAYPVVAGLASLLTTALFDYDIGNNIVAAMLFIFAACLVVCHRQVNNVGWATGEA